MKNLEVPPGHKIISLDAASFFTNVQIGIAINSFTVQTENRKVGPKFTGRSTGRI